MKKKQPINKISAIIGITLFVSIIGFTIVTNIPVKEVEKEFKPFTQNKLDDFWKLDSMKIYAGRVIESEQKYSMRIYKKMGITRSRFEIRSDKNGESKSIEIPVDSTYYLGILRFKTKTRNSKEEPLFFEKYKIEWCIHENDSILMKEIGSLILKYQISYITTRSYNGDFTAIRLKDGRKVFLIKKDANIIDNYHKELIEKASFINDSTKVILPLAIQKIYDKYHETIDGITRKKK
ncbi:hypothetical protein Fleli_0579 [Bernardetia litoralis DSM 6794]|uniref:Uncharacterized protein n=1 Tax=Bernardetia litoralis (strain ATCC 23117 / DSM 6794 / NBRC 15988 / NCIMB 1366 / Fx l1 / Sio-4) TaxID=880071 RepID=I4AGG0_BERLS|nr:hypothetical protein [Bernardetia litoralis]AFM03045.1 hypothetical protein Fleli_0579 [Bernardetia litoralis DSM 6794]